MGGSAVVGAEAFRRGSGFATGARPWLRSSSPLLSKRHTRWRVRSDANSAEATRYVDQCVPPSLVKLVNREGAVELLAGRTEDHLLANVARPDEIVVGVPADRKMI